MAVYVRVWLTSSNFPMRSYAWKMDSGSITSYEMFPELLLQNITEVLIPAGIFVETHLSYLQCYMKK